MMSWGILIASLAGIWVFFDARKRGSEPATAAMWAVGTVALLFVVLPLYLLVGRKAAIKPIRRQEVIDVEAIPVEDVIYCPMCGGKGKDDYIVCPHCSHTLKPACTACGKSLERTWRVCPFCQEPTAHK